MDRPDLVVAQTVFHGEIGETRAVEACDTLAPASEPVVALAVLEDGAHGLEPKPCRRTDGAVVQLRSRHVLLRRAGGCGDKSKHCDGCQSPTHLTARHPLLHVSHWLLRVHAGSLSAQRPSSCLCSCLSTGYTSAAYQLRRTRDLAEA